MNHTVQPWCFHSRMGGGVLCEPSFPVLKISNPGEWFVVNLVPSRPRALTKVEVKAKVKHMVAPIQGAQGGKSTG